MAIRPTEGQHPRSLGLHASTGAEVLNRLLAAQRLSLDAVAAVLPQLEQAADRAADALRGGGKLAYAGAGSSGLMGLADCLELAGTFGIPPDRTPMLFAGGTDALIHMTGSVEDDPALALADLAKADLGPGDALIALSASGGTPYTLVIAQAARVRGAQVIGVANVPGSRLLDMADVAICLDTGAEVISGSTRMAAGTAQKAALNMLSVLMGIRLGHVHDGHMVNVVADNAKLLDRAARIVAAIACVPADAAASALARTGGAVKPAILVAQGYAPDAADTALRASEGHLAGLLLPNRA